MKVIKFKNTEEIETKFSVESLANKVAKCNISANGKVLFLTPKILSMVHEDEVLVDVYGNRNTKKELDKTRQRPISSLENGGATIYGLEIIEE